MDYKNLEKLYPVKIPVYEHAEYYLDLLKRSPEYSELNRWISMCLDFEKIEDHKSHKYKKIEESVNIFKQLGITDIINNMNFRASNFQNIGHVPVENKLYLSIDIKQANFSTVKHFSGIKESWEEFAKEKLNLHNALINSKSFRQVIFGHLNPKRISTLQCYLTEKNLNLLKDYSIVGVKQDEIILELNETDLEKVRRIEFVIPVKLKPFTTKFYTNYNEHVRVDTIYDENLNKKYDTITGGNGNRFFIHFKTLILKEELDERDLLFKNDGFLAKWVL